MEKKQAVSLIERHVGYRPIDGEVVGIVEEVTDKDVHFRIKDTIFIIPIERFSEYFERA